MLKKIMALSLASALVFSTFTPGVVFAAENELQSDKPVRTTFQVGQLYNPGMHVPADSVMVYPFGIDGLDNLFNSWKDKGYQLDAMISINHDWFGNYVKADPANREKEIQRDKNGNPVDFIAGTHYMVPTLNWLNYTWALIERSMDHGARNITLEEPDFFKKSGYSEAFKEEWQAYYNEPWQDPETNQEIRFKSERLKVYLMERFLQTLAQRIKQKNPDSKVYVATHSVMSYNAGNITAGGVYYTNIPEIDGIVGQCWTDTAKFPIPYKGGSAEKIFESSYIEYSSMVNLTAPSGKEFFALADPKADDGSKTWREYEKWWKQTLAAQLLQKDVKQFEPFLWPDRSFAGAPDRYKTIQLSVFNALEDLYDKTANITSAGTQGITLALSDTLSWQYGFGSPDTVASFYGMTIPLVEKGIPVKIMPLENIKTAQDLSDTKVLVLSYDNQKPTEAAYNEAISDWVKAGGVLLYMGSDDPFNHMNLWWKQAGYDSPYEHLLSELGILEDVTYTQRISRENESTLVWQRADGKNYGDGVEIPQRYAMTKFCGNMEPLFKSGDDIVAYGKQIGNGYMIDIGIGSSTSAQSEATARLICDMTAYACEKAGISYAESDSMSIERGNYIVYETFENSVVLSGKYIDLFDSKLSVVTKKLIAPNSAAMLYDISGLDTEVPKVGFTGGEVVGDIIETEALTELTIKGPTSSNSATRIMSNSRLYPRQITGKAKDGSSVDIGFEWENSTKSLVVFTPNQVEGVTLSVQWDTDFVADTPKTVETGVLIETNSNNLDAGYLIENTGNANEEHRFADDAARLVYKIKLGDYPGAKIKLDLACNFDVKISSDNSTWQEALNSRTLSGQEFIPNGANRGVHLIDPADFGIAPDGDIYILLTDSNTDIPGWGGFLYSIEIVYRVPAEKFEVEAENPEFSVGRGQTGVNYALITNRTGQEQMLGVDLKKTSTTEDKIFFEAGKDLEVKEIAINIDPNTEGEGQYLPEELQNGSGVVAGSWIRFCDATKYAVYKLPLTGDYTSYNILLDVDNEYEYSLSADGVTYDVIGREERQVGVELAPNANRKTHTIPVEDMYQSQDGFVYLKIGDSHPTTGWGAEIFKIQLQGVKSGGGTGSTAEGAFLYEDQSSGVVSSEPFRYADGQNYFVYRLPAAKNFSEVLLTVFVQNEFEISASKDGSDYTVVGKEERTQADFADGGNLEYRTYPISDFVNQDGEVFIKVGDSHKEDGYGAILRSLKLSVTTETDYEDSIEVAGPQQIVLSHNQTARIPVVVSPGMDSHAGRKNYRLTISDGNEPVQEFLMGYTVTAQKPVYEAKYTAQDITVDGDIEETEWSDANEFIISPTSRVVMEFGTVWGNQGEEADIVSRYKFKWDDSKLYVMETRTDNVLNFTQNGSQMYLSDANMLFLDLNNKNDGVNYKEGDYAIMFSASGTDGKPHVFLRKGTNSEMLEYSIDDLVDIASVITGNQYTLEMAIPWSVFDAALFTAQNDKIVSMSLLATDNDGDGNWGQIMWVGNGDEQSNWAKMKFVGKPGIEIPEEPEIYTVTFDVDGVKTEVMTTVGEGIVPPSDPAKDGYTFKGWYTASAGGTEVTVFDTTMTVYAQWTQNSSSGESGGGNSGPSIAHYTITASAGGGGKISPLTSRIEENSSRIFTMTPDEGYEVADVTVDGKSIGAVTTYTFSNVTGNHTISVTFKKVEKPQEQETLEYDNPFADVNENHWFYDSVMYVCQHGFMRGVSAEKFNPLEKGSRGMIVTILYTLAGKPKAGANGFKDIKDGQWYTDAVSWAAENKIVSGYGNGAFGPNDNITREQMAVIFYNYAKHKGYNLSETSLLEKFTDDSKVSGWAREALQWIVGSGMMNGKGNNILDPKGTATRAEMASIMQKFMKKYT